jgi:hypothetical protein
VLLFKSILENENETGRLSDKRRATRYPVGDAFPFKVKLTLFPKGTAQTSDTKGKEWSATPVDLSAKGASVQLSMAAVAFPKEPCRLRFTLRDFQLELPATINHFRCLSQHSLCGITFNLSEAGLQKAYRQLLEPLIIGHALTPAKAVQDVPGRHKDQYGGNATGELSVLRTSPGGQITGFDLRMNNYLVRWAEGAPQMELLCLDENPTTSRAPTPDAMYEDILRLFTFTVPNLPESVPADVRMFFKGLVPR